MHRHGNRAIVSPGLKSSRQMTHSPLASSNVSSVKCECEFMINNASNADIPAAYRYMRVLVLLGTWLNGIQYRLATRTYCTQGIWYLCGRKEFNIADQERGIYIYIYKYHWRTKCAMEAMLLYKRGQCHSLMLPMQPMQCSQRCLRQSSTYPAGQWANENGRLWGESSATYAYWVTKRASLLHIALCGSRGTVVVAGCRLEAIAIWISWHRDWNGGMCVRVRAGSLL